MLAKGFALRPNSMFRLFAGTLFAVTLLAPAITAQTAVGGPVSLQHKDTAGAILKPAAGVKLAIMEWEDLECPACRGAFPVVHSAVSTYGIPLYEMDFQIPGHRWSAQAALYARYIKDKISADMATDYRRQLFKAQPNINSVDDLRQFTQQFFTKNGKQMPFVVDADGKLAKEIQADNDLANKIGLSETPTIVVVTPREWIQVRDTADLYQAIDKAKADLAAAPAPTAAKKPAAPVKKPTAK